MALMRRLVTAAERIADSMEAETMEQDEDGPQYGSLSDVPR